MKYMWSPKQHSLAFEDQSRTVNSEFFVTDRRHLADHQNSTCTSSPRRTKPIVELFNPCLPGVFNWRVEEDNLVLYPDFVNDGL